VFYYHGNAYYKWEANCNYKQYTAYVDVDTTKDSTTITSTNKPLSN